MQAVQAYNQRSRPSHRMIEKWNDYRRGVAPGQPPDHLEILCETTLN